MAVIVLIYGYITFLNIKYRFKAKEVSEGTKKDSNRKISSYWKTETSQGSVIMTSKTERFLKRKIPYNKN